MDKEVKEKKLYKGKIVKVGELAKGFKGPVAIQPTVRKTMIQGYSYELPPSFVLTKFQPGGFPGLQVINYYSPTKKMRMSMNVPDDVEFNVLEGTRGKELSAEYTKMMETSFTSLARRMVTTVGADPELFVEDKNGVVPAWKFLGSKEKPETYGWEGAKGEVYWDGFQAEFTTPPGITCLVKMGDSIRHGLKKINALKPKKSALSMNSVVPVSPEVLAEAKEEHVQFGCAPSFNVYGLKGNTQDGRNVPFRFAGGHIHLGLNETQRPLIPAFVKALDSVLAVACVSLFAGYDSKVRRQFYGQPGEYRTPAHGMEYRVLSNAWLSHPAMFNLVFEAARAVVGVVDDGFDIATMWKSTEDRTVDVVMNADVDGARAILTDNKKFFMNLMALCGESFNREFTWETWTKGLGFCLANPLDIERNWRLNSDTEWGAYEMPRYWNRAAKGI